MILYIKENLETFKSDFFKDFWWLSHEMAMYFNIYIHTCMMIMTDTNFHVTVMLCSTTGPYGRLVIDVAYGEMILLLHWGCMGDDSSRKVVRSSAWRIAHVWHIQVNTSVGIVYIIFWFSIYKNLVDAPFCSGYFVRLNIVIC